MSSSMGHRDDFGLNLELFVVDVLCGLALNGSFTIGYTTSLPVSVYNRTDVGLQTNVVIPANSSVGFWTDDDGNNGTFEFDILSQPSG